jgi:hypothetical protein
LSISEVGQHDPMVGAKKRRSVVGSLIERLLRWFPLAHGFFVRTLLLSNWLRAVATKNTLIANPDGLFFQASHGPIRSQHEWTKAKNRSRICTISDPTIVDRWIRSIRSIDQLEKPALNGDGLGFRVLNLSCAGKSRMLPS